MPPGSFPYTGHSDALESCAHTVGHTITMKQTATSKTKLPRRVALSLMGSHFRLRLAERQNSYGIWRCRVSGRQPGNYSETGFEEIEGVAAQRSTAIFPATGLLDYFNAPLECQRQEPNQQMTPVPDRSPRRY